MDTAEAATRRELRRALNAAFYKINVESGKQELYQLNNRDRKRAANVLKLLPEDKIHLFKPVMLKLSQMPKWNRASAWQIQVFIEQCDHEYERSLAASASGRSDDGNAVSSTHAESSTATSTGDTPAQVSVNQDEDTFQSTSRTFPKDSQNANTDVAAAAAPADGAALITPDKPADNCNGQTNDGVVPSSSGSASDHANGLSEDGNFVHFSDTDDNYDIVRSSSVKSASDSEQESEPVPTKKRRLAREVDALVRSRPGSLPLDGNDWKKPVRSMILWKAYGLDKAPQQPTSICLHNAGQFPFYKNGTNIHRINLAFVPPNTRFPNDAAMNEAAIAARALIADEFGGDELLNQRDRKYSAPNFHTVFYMDKTCTVCSAVHDQGVNNACETYSPMNKCISVAYFTQLKGDGDGSACMWIEWLVTAKDYRNKKLGIGKLLLENILHLAITDEGVDSVYLEVGSGNGDWEAARHMYDGVGFDVVSDLSTLPKSVEEQCKHHGDRRYDVLRFDCEKNKSMF